MEGFITFLGIVMFVFGILQIILFFKVWGMTDNVSHIKSIINDNAAPSLKDLLLQGHTDKAAQIIIEQLVEQLKDDIVGSYGSKEERRMKIADSIAKAKEKLAIINKVNVLPPHLESMENFVEYYNKVSELF